MPQVYNFNNEFFDPAGGKLRKFGSKDEARAQYGDFEEIGLSNDDWSNIQSGGPLPGYKPTTQTTPSQPAQGGGQSYSPPPPPPPPAFQPMGVFPATQPIAQPGRSPDFMKIADIGAPVAGTAYTPPPSLMEDNQLMEALNRFSGEGLANPSRWDAPLVQESLGVIDEGIARNRAEGSRFIDENMSRRGVSGSSIQWDEGYSLEDRLDENERAAKNQLAREVANTTAQDRALAGGLALDTTGMLRTLDRDRTSDAQFAFGANRQVGRDLEDDKRSRAGIQLQGGALSEDATMSRAGFGLSANNQQFNQGMAGAVFGEGQRQFNVATEQQAAQFAASMGLNWAQLSQQDRQFVANLAFQQEMGRGDLSLREELGRGGLDLARQQFGENQRQFNQDFGLRDYLGRAGIGLDERQIDEQIRQFDTMDERQKEQFAQSIGLTKEQLEEGIRHNKQLETIAILDYLERTNSGFTIDENGQIVPQGPKAEDDDPKDNKTPPAPVNAFKPGEYGSPKTPKQGETWSDPSGKVWKFDGRDWKRVTAPYT